MEKNNEKLPTGFKVFIGKNANEKDQNGINRAAVPYIKKADAPKCGTVFRKANNYMSSS